MGARLPRIAAFGRPVERVGTDAAGLDLSTASVDAVVSTWTLCTILALVTALAEIARVLRPGGALHFVEHTTSDHPALARAQAVVQPVRAPGPAAATSTGTSPGSSSGRHTPSPATGEGDGSSRERPPHGAQRTQHTHRELTTCFIPPGYD